MSCNEGNDSDYDAGRYESEKLLRNKTNTKYLNDVLKQGEMEYEEAVEMIDRDKKMFDSASDGFLSSLDVSTHEKMMERAMDRAENNTHNRRMGVRSTFARSEDLMRHASDASAAVKRASSSPYSYKESEQARKAEQEELKSVLKAGKRAMAADLAGLERCDSKGAGVGGGEGAGSVFAAEGAGKDASGVDRLLKHLDKGVKKMTKGFD